MSSLLRCGDCGAPIRGFTGLMELQNLRKHMARKHGFPVDMNEALIIREVYEDGRPYLANPERLAGGSTVGGLFAKKEKFRKGP